MRDVIAVGSFIHCGMCIWPDIGRSRGCIGLSGPGGLYCNRQNLLRSLCDNLQLRQ
jgi:hypothetical protein